MENKTFQTIYNTSLKKRLGSRLVIIAAIFIGLIILTLAGFKIYKFRIVSIIYDEMICELPNSMFRFYVFPVDYNTLRIYADYYQGRGILLLDDPFYDGGEINFPRKREKIYISVSEEYDITLDKLLKDEKGLYVSYISKSEKEQYGLSERFVDFYVDNYTCCPALLEFYDGRKIIIYKKFNYLFLKEIEA